MRLFMILCVMAFGFWDSPASAARQGISATIDLAVLAQDASEKRPVRPGAEISITIINRVPDVDYTVDLEQIGESIPTLTYPGKTKQPKASGPPPTHQTPPTICDEREKRLKARLPRESSEKEVPEVTHDLLDLAAAANCRELMSATIDLLTTRRLGNVDPLAPGESLSVTVSRVEDKQTVRVWKVLLAAGPSGEWRVSYGFNFIPNHDKEFFSRQDPINTTEFTVTRQRDRKSADFAPSVFFTWLSAGQSRRSLAVSPAAGLGFDLESPIVFGGVALTFRQNVTVTGGVVYHKQKRLDGRFREGQTITENLDSDQLEFETYRPNAYIGLSFRFGSDPFTKGEE